MSRGRDDEAFEGAIRENRAALLGYLQRRTRSAEDAAEAFGELLLTAWRVRRKMPADATAARMWLYGVARNIIRTEQRSSARRSDAVRQLREQVAVESAEAPVARHDDLRDAIAALPDEDAELIRLVYWDGLPSHEAAAVLGLNASTARSRLLRLKAALRTAIETNRSLATEHAPNGSA